MKIHIGYSSSHMLIELFKQFLIDRDTLLKTVRTFSIIIKRLVCIRWTSDNHANNNLGTSNHTRTASDSEIHLLSVVSFYIFQFCRIRAARFLEHQIPDICNSLLLFVILSHIPLQNYYQEKRKENPSCTLLKDFWPCSPFT